VACRRVGEGSVFTGRECVSFDLHCCPGATGEGGDVGICYEVCVGEFDAFWEASRAGGPEDGDKTLTLLFGIRDSSPL